MHTSYDQVPYESHPFVQTLPDHIATIGILLGMRPPSPTRCRVLELGCASGGNLIPMAYSLPESQWVGIDLSTVQVAQGQETIKALGLKNIELKQQSILDVGADMGKFDYILCHGVYSWVPQQVQDKILDICATNLNPDGIAYVSYNTYPGWHMRGMIRDMLFYHAKQFAEPAVRLKQARSLLDFLAKAAVKDTGPYGLLLRSELESIRAISDSYLYHEHLEDINEPIYFHQFVEKATAKGLKYLGEADLRVMVPGNYPPEIAKVLQTLTRDLVRMEQYMDFLRNRTFRQTLLCHKNQQLSYGLRWEQLRPFHVASPAKVAEEKSEQTEDRRPKTEGRRPDIDLQAAEPLRFEAADGLKLSAGEPIVKAAMLALEEVWPAALPFAALVKEARSKLRSTREEAADEKALGQALLGFYAQASTSLLELWLDPPTFLPQPSARPVASPLARHQAKTGKHVTNLRHESVFLGEFERQLVCLLDGTRDRNALVEGILALVIKGDLKVEEHGQPLAAGERLRVVIEQAVQRQLATIARNALLVG